MRDSPRNSPGSLDLTVVILTFNEERHIERCIKSVSSFVRRVVIVDSFSTDKTKEIALGLGATVLENAFVNHSKQFHWGLEHSAIDTQWVMRLDADEVIEPDLAENLTLELPDLARSVVGITLKRKHIFMGRWIRHGGRYPVTLLRIWRTGQGRVEDRWMDEHVIVWGGETITISGGFSDINLNNLTYFTAKHNHYATLEALEQLSHKYSLSDKPDQVEKVTLSYQAKSKRWIKENFYNKLPFWMGPLGYFLYRYIFQVGFLDGREGLIYHSLQGYWYRFLVAAKTVELDREIAHFKDNRSRILRLRALTGLPFLTEHVPARQTMA